MYFVVYFGCIYTYLFCLLNDKKALKKFGLRTWYTKKTFRLSSRTQHALTTFYKLKKEFFN